MHDEIVDKYDASAAFYDARYKDLQLKKYDTVFSYLDDVEGEILDIGCGTGLLGEYLGKRIWGLDNSQGMLDHSKNRIRKIKADARHIPFPDNSFDWIFCFTVLQNIEDYMTALLEMERVIKPSGKVVISYLNKKDFSNIGNDIRLIFNVDRSFSYSEDIFYICSAI